MEIASIIGAVSGLLSILGIIYMMGVWRGKVDTKLKQLDDYPLGEIALMTKTLWDLYVVDALRSRPDLAEHGSAYRLKKEGESLIPQELKDELDSLALNAQEAKANPTGWQIVKALGMERIQTFADERELSLQQTIAILATYVENNAGV